MLKIKSFTQNIGSEWVVIIVVLAVGLSSFMLGLLSAPQGSVSSISVETVAMQASAPLSQGGLLVGSKNGSKYHYPWCGGAKQIAERNKIWFKNEEEARRAGYAPAGNCKGL